MIALLGSKAGRLIAAALACLVALTAVYWFGREDARRAAEIDRLERREETRETIRRIENETRNQSDDWLIDRLSR